MDELSLSPTPLPAAVQLLPSRARCTIVERGVFEEDEQLLGRQHTDVSPPQTVHILGTQSRVDGSRARRIGSQAVPSTSQDPPGRTVVTARRPFRTGELPPRHRWGNGRPRRHRLHFSWESPSPRRTLAGPVCISSSCPPRIAGRLTPARDRPGVPRSAATRPPPPRRAAPPPRPCSQARRTSGAPGSCLAAGHSTTSAPRRRGRRWQVHTYAGACQKTARRHRRALTTAAVQQCQ